MCGRYTNATTWAEVHAASKPLQLQAPTEEPVAELNIAPTQAAWVLRLEGSLLVPARLRWGLLPAWSKEPKTRFSAFNARVESVAEKPVFRSAFRARRCLVPASGWYEWREEAGRKRPFLFTPAGAGALLFAGLWERWQQGETCIDSFTVLTTEARGQVAEVHDRMPVLVSGRLAAHWLDTTLADAPAFALSCDLPELRVWPDQAPPRAPAPLGADPVAKRPAAKPAGRRSGKPGGSSTRGADSKNADASTPEQSKLF